MSSLISAIVPTYNTRTYLDFDICDLSSGHFRDLPIISQ